MTLYLGFMFSPTDLASPFVYTAGSVLRENSAYYLIGKSFTLRAIKLASRTFLFAICPASDDVDWA